jgi:SP family sugar:H+ symporter-like MFS transporter
LTLSTDTGCYRIPIAVQFAWAIVLITGMLILPETPRYLIKSGRPEKAAHSLAKLRRLPEDHVAIRDELAEIEANHEYELSLGKATYLDCFRGNLLKRQLTGCGLQALQQLTGINFIVRLIFMLNLSFCSTGIWSLSSFSKGATIHLFLVS